MILDLLNFFLSSDHSCVVCLMFSEPLDFKKNVSWKPVVHESAPPRQAPLNEQCSSPQRGLWMCHASQLKHGLQLTPKWQTEQVSSALASRYNSTTLPWRAITHSRAKNTLVLLLGHYRRGMTDFSANKERTYFKSRRKQTYWRISVQD